MKKLFKETLTEAKNGLSTIQHEFLLEYKKDKKHIYAFVEGPEDVCFYQNFLKSHLNNKKCTTQFYPCSNKNNVLSILECLNWDKISSKQVLFFIDRDLSYFFKEKVKRKRNLYITDGYSIENSIVTSELLIRHLQESGAIHIIPESTKEILQKKFDTLKEEFCIAMSDIMIWFISSKQNNLNPILNNIQAKHIVDIKNMKLTSKSKKDKAKIFKVRAKCVPKTKLAVSTLFSTSKATRKKYIRGKFMLEFFSMFLDDIFSNKENIDCLKACRLNKNGVETNIEAIAHRCECPKSLKTFFQRTVDVR